MKKKVAIAMSGGVDSGVAAALLVKAGYKAAGFHMKLWSEKKIDFENKCCSTESLEAARRTAHKLGIPFYIVDLKKIFKKRVVDYFLQSYAAGLTPNPCVMCNKFIKFGELLDYVRKLGYDFLATGHYAKVVGGARDALLSQLRATRFSLMSARKIKDPPPKAGDFGTDSLKTVALRLLMAKDKKKDQSYFLYNLTQKQLAHVLFPVGDYTKKQVIAMAKKWRLPVVERPESQKICFFPETDYRPFLKRQIREKIIPGDVIDTQGKVLGKHQGIPLYTIGQRRGFTITDKKVIGPLYVIGKNVKKNQLIVGFGKEAERKEFWLEDVNWVNPYCVSRITYHGLKCQVRIRHQGELLECRVRRDTQEAIRKTKKNLSRITYHVSLSESERGIAPGQAAVFYHKEEVLGGGIIAK